MKRKKKITLLFIVAWLFLPYHFISGQAFKNISYQIADFKSAKESNDFLDSLDVLLDDSNWPEANIGMSIYLEYSEADKEVFLSPANQGYTLVDFLTRLEKLMAARPHKIVPLFLTFNGIQQKVERTFLKSNLAKHIYQRSDEQTWSDDIKFLTNKKTNLVLFALDDLEGPSSILNSAKRNVAELPFYSFSAPGFEGVYKSGTIQHRLMMLRHFTDINLDGINSPNDWTDFNIVGLIPDYVKSCWMMTGKRPNFIFYNNIYLCRTFMWLEKLVNLMPHVSGNIESVGNPLTYVGWENHLECITNHSFSFPFIDDLITLRPHQLGMSFEPASVKINISDDLTKEIKFKTSYFELEDGLTAYYPLNTNIENVVVPSEKAINNGGTFHSSIDRGNVLKIKGSAHLILAHPGNYGLVKNSLTVGVHVKMLSRKSRDAMIIGTNSNTPRSGLHLVLRHNTPYAGFFSFGVSGDTIINDKEWNHLVFRYDQARKEQTIFLNGKKIATRKNSPTFIGSTNIRVGSGLGIDDSFDGYLDNIGIWKRALSDGEVQLLYTRGINENNIVKLKRKDLEIPNEEKSNPLWKNIVLVVLAVISIVLVWRVVIRKLNSSQELDVKEKQPVKAAKNAIFFFGNFTVYDKLGNDISNLFAPKVKELFILISLFTFKSNKGISSEQLTSIIWKGYSHDKASNNRGVTFNKLRKALTNVEGVSINFEYEHWRIIFDANVECDYHMVLKYLERMNELDKNEFKQFFEIVKRGNLLHRLNWKWLEEFKDTLGFDIVDALLLYTAFLDKTKNSKELYEVSKFILSIDNLNEHALQLQIQVLSNQGHINKAQFLLDHFKEKYMESNGEHYTLTIKELLGKNFRH